MTVKTVKINLLPVSKERETEYLLGVVMRKVSGIRKIIDDWGKRYEHEIPWEENFLKDPKFYLYRVRIGAIGRINSCKNAAQLGLIAKIPAKTGHFTSVALYLVYRIARQTRREYIYLKKLNNYMEVWLGEKSDIYDNARFINYSNF